MPRPVEHWVESKIMSPSADLAVAVYYFLYSVVPFLEDPPRGPRRLRRKKDTDKKDNDEEPMVH